MAGIRGWILQSLSDAISSCLLLRALELCVPTAGTFLTGSLFLSHQDTVLLALPSALVHRILTAEMSLLKGCHSEACSCCVFPAYLPVTAGHCPEVHHCSDHLADTERKPCGGFCPLLRTALCIGSSHFTYAGHSPGLLQSLILMKRMLCNCLRHRQSLGTGANETGSRRKTNIQTASRITNPIEVAKRVSVGELRDAGSP